MARAKKGARSTGPRLVESAELAAALEVERSTIYRWARSGLPVAKKSGRRNYYDIEACRAWAKKHQGHEPSAHEAERPEVSLEEISSLRGEGLRDALTRAKVEKERELARIQRARAEREEGSQIPVGDVKRLVTDLFGLVRARLEAAPSQLAEKLAAIQEPLVIQSEMRDWVRLVQGDLKQLLKDYVDAT